LIGWAPKATASPVARPGQPRELRSIKEDADKLTLQWKSPARTDGGRVRTYLVERREQAAEGAAFDDWRQVGVALETNITLEAQPRHRDLEYRVTAMNHAGQGLPSNALPVVL